MGKDKDKKKKKRDKEERRREKEEKRGEKEKEEGGEKDKAEGEGGEKSEKEGGEKIEKKEKKEKGEKNEAGRTYSVQDIADKADVGIREIKGFFDAFRRRLEKMKVGSRIRLPGICNFEKIETKARKSRNPRTGESVDVPAKRKIRVKVSGNLKNL